MRFSSSTLGALFLIITTLFWGGGFVAQKLGADHLGPAALILTRSLVAALFLVGVEACRRRNGFTRTTLVRGFLCGLALFAGMYAQQRAFDFKISPGVCAFLTANYILLVPLLGALIGRRPSRTDALAVIPALIGTYFICVTGTDTFHVGMGELWTLLCAALFAVEILVVDRLAPGSDPLALSAVMFLTCATASVPFLFLSPDLPLLSVAHVKAAFPAVLFLGLGSSGVGYTLQNVAQGLRTPPALAALIMSLESVFGALFGWLFCGETFTGRSLAGCALVFAAALWAGLVQAFKGDTKWCAKQSLAELVE